MVGRRLTLHLVAPLVKGYPAIFQKLGDLTSESPPMEITCLGKRALWYKIEVPPCDFPHPG